MKRKIVYVNAFIDDELKDRVRATAESLGFEIEFFSRASAALSAARDAEIIFGDDMELVRAAEKLRWICTSFAGVNKLELEYLEERAITLTNSSGAYGITIAEHMIMVLTIMLRSIPAYDRLKRERVFKGGLPTKTICGSRILLLGTGDIGSKAARRLRSFEPESIVGLSRSGREPEGPYKGVFDRVDRIERIEEYLPDADILLMCLPGTRETAGVLSAERIRLLPEGAYIVNVGRGSAIDEAALVAALREGRIAGAALDVLKTEPLPKESPLWDVENLYLTPHIAGQETAPVTRRLIAEMFMDDLKSYAAGKPLKHKVDLKAGY